MSGGVTMAFKPRPVVTERAATAPATTQESAAGLRTRQVAHRTQRSRVSR